MFFDDQFAQRPCLCECTDQLAAAGIGSQEGPERNPWAQKHTLVQQIGNTSFEECFLFLNIPKVCRNHELHKRNRSPLPSPGIPLPRIVCSMACPFETERSNRCNRLQQSRCITAGLGERIVHQSLLFLSFLIFLYFRAYSGCRILLRVTEGRAYFFDGLLVSATEPRSLDDGLTVRIPWKAICFMWLG